MGGLVGSSWDCKKQKEWKLLESLANSALARGLLTAADATGVVLVELLFEFCEAQTWGMDPEIRGGKLLAVVVLLAAGFSAKVTGAFVILYMGFYGAFAIFVLTLMHKPTAFSAKLQALLEEEKSTFQLVAKCSNCCASVSSFHVSLDPVQLKEQKESYARGYAALFMLSAHKEKSGTEAASEPPANKSRNLGRLEPGLAISNPASAPGRAQAASERASSSGATTSVQSVLI
jgi:hypothetical protein